MLKIEDSFFKQPIVQQARELYLEGTFVVSIRYYGYKVNLYIYKNQYIEVFYNHKLDLVEKIQLMDYQHTRMKFYADQIKIKSLAS
ncbi:hypothetical protein [Roseivirga misakiensis]|uniref:Uncharacterized protein n=1 Tax=Roseivirga misakiensis TaxID=1563681 RepID=A0A1E5T4L7_9BACT|nr:hypothetical protein [Roseivirga misakiensis]OEK06320.1 hypothetical protein BFP71_01190 [Roseivirga misakiensis]